MSDTEQDHDIDALEAELSELTAAHEDGDRSVRTDLAETLADAVVAHGTAGDLAAEADRLDRLGSLYESVTGDGAAADDDVEAGDAAEADTEADDADAEDEEATGDADAEDEEATGDDGDGDAAAVRRAYARALRRASEVENEDRGLSVERDAETIRERQRRLVYLHEAGRDPAVGEHLAYATGEWIVELAEDERFEEVADEIQRIRELHDEHDTEAIGEALAMALVVEARFHVIKETGDLDEAFRDLQFVDNLSRQYPDSDEVTEALARVLDVAVHAAYYDNDPEEMQRTFRRLEGLYQQYPRPEVGLQVVDALTPALWVATATNDTDEIREVIERSEEVLEAHPDEPTVVEQVAGHYAEAADYFAENEDQPDEPVIEAYDRLRELDEEYGDREDLDLDLDLRPYRLRATPAAIALRARQGDVETARAMLAELEEAYERDPDLARNAYAEGVGLFAFMEIQSERLDAAQEHVDVLKEIDLQVEDDSSPLEVADLQASLHLGQGSPGVPVEEKDATVEAVDEAEGFVDVAVSDGYGLDHTVRLDLDGEWIDGEVAGVADDYEPSDDEATILYHGYEFARHHADAETDHDLLERRQRPDRIEAVRDVLAGMDADEFGETFEDYLAAHAFHYADNVLFVDRPEPPIDTTDLNVESDDVLAIYEQDVYLDEDDEAVAGLGPVRLTSVGDAGRQVVREAPGEAPFDREPDARIEIGAPHPVYRADALQRYVVHHLNCQLRDRYLLMGVEPPERYRVGGEGLYEALGIWADTQLHPNYMAGVEELDAYRPGIDAEAEALEQFRATVRDRFADRARAVNEAYATAPDPSYEDLRSGEPVHELSGEDPVAVVEEGAADGAAGGPGGDDPDAGDPGGGDPDAGDPGGDGPTAGDADAGDPTPGSPGGEGAADGDASEGDRPNEDPADDGSATTR